MRSPARWWPAGLVIAMLSRGTYTSAQSLAYIGSTQYAAGEYVFKRQVWSAYMSNGVAWSAERIRISASIPLVIQDVGLVQYSGAGMMVPTGGMANGEGTPQAAGMMSAGTMSGPNAQHIGIGDPVARIDARLAGERGLLPAIWAIGSTKAPVADVAHGFGTGEWDVGGGLSLEKSLTRTSFVAEAVYWKLGNPPGGEFRNAVAYSLSGGQLLGNGQLSVLGSVFGASSLWRGLAAPLQAALGLGYRFPSGSGISGSVAAGLTRSTPDLAIAAAWRIPM